MRYNFEPTKEQKAAVNCLDNHAAITAGAGAGKTKVLIYRILEIVLEKKAAFNQIAAITFTEKAASEMKVKLRKEAKAQLERNPHLKEQLKDVSSAHISTIHSFCNSIIKRFALDINLTPDYQIVLEDEADRLLRKSINKVLEDLEEHSQVINVDYLVRFRAENFNLVKDLAMAYNKIREFGFTIEEALALTRHKFNEAKALSMAALNDFIKALDKADSLKDNLKGQAKTAKFVTLMLENWPISKPLFLRLQANIELTPAEKLQLIDFLGLINSKDKISNVFGEDVIKAVKEGILVITFLFAESDVKTLLEGFHALLAHIDKQYLKLKQEKQALDFIDLQLEALKLLKKPHAKKELLKDLRFVMIDEYQDTNYLQQRIIDELWQDNLNLFIVGDPKQSIYRFRGAEVALFAKTTEEILAKNGKEIFLSYNFRSQKDLIDFYNTFFELFMPGDSQKSYAIGYEKIQTKKTASDKCFHIIACPYDYKLEEKIPPQRWQAKAIARLIFEAVNENKNNKKIHYGDFAVLFHKRSAGLFELEEELAQAKIPFVSGMGLDFFAREEIRDCLALLNFLNTPLDELSLAAVLKGPFFNQDEKVLYSLFQKAKENKTSPYGALLLFGGTESIVQREKEAWGILESKGDDFSELARDLARLRIEYGYKSLAVLLTELIQSTQFNFVLQGQLMGEERSANLEKLLELIAAQDRKGLSNSEIVEYLNMAKEAGTADAEVVSESTDRVTIMTVHAAKGLEFKRVILTGINLSQRSLPEPLMAFDKEQGLIVGLLNKIGNLKVKCTDPRFYISRERIKDEEEYEKQRLFYVASTRAMQELYLVVAGDFLTKEFKTTNPVLKQFSWDQEKVSFNNCQAYYYPYEYAIFPSLKKELNMPSGRLDQVILKPKYRALSPTALIQFRICPRLFYLEQRLKVPPLKDLITGEETNNNEPDNDFDGQTIGTVLHRIFAEAKDLKEAELIFNQADLPQIYYPILPHYFASEFYNKGQSEVPISLYLPQKRLRFIGIVDRLIWEKEKITIIDFKTHCQGNFALKAKEYDLQMAVYALALKTRFQKAVEALIYFPYPDKIYPVRLNKAEALLEQIVDDINNILDKKLLPEAKPKDKCLVNCPYLALCHRD